jgi:hypothetical protein
MCTSDLVAQVSTSKSMSMFYEPTLISFNQKASKFHQFIQEIISKKLEAKRTVIAESNAVRLSRIQSAVRKDVERAHIKNEKKDSAKEIKLTDWNRHLTDADVEIRKWDSGNVLTEQVSWRTSKFDMRKRIVVLVWM